MKKKKKFQNTTNRSGAINYHIVVHGCALWSISLQLFYFHIKQLLESYRKTISISQQYASFSSHKNSRFCSRYLRYALISFLNVESKVTSEVLNIAGFLSQNDNLMDFDLLWVYEWLLCLYRRFVFANCLCTQCSALHKLCRCYIVYWACIFVDSIVWCYYIVVLYSIFMSFGRHDEPVTI